MKSYQWWLFSSGILTSGRILAESPEEVFIIARDDSIALRELILQPPLDPYNARVTIIEDPSLP